MPPFAAGSPGGKGSSAVTRTEVNRGPLPQRVQAWSRPMTAASLSSRLSRGCRRMHSLSANPVASAVKESDFVPDQACVEVTQILDRLAQSRRTVSQQYRSRHDPKAHPLRKCAGRVKG